ncbi:MAG: substrate-binding domain-containing protein, partial [Caldilineaceae bacterium]
HNIIDGVATIEVVCQQTGNFNRADGLSVTENCLTGNPDAQVIVAANDDMALGAVEAVKAAGLTMPILGYDALPEALQAISAGDLYGTVEQFPGEQSATALRTIIDFIRDGVSPESDTVFIAPKMITSENFAEAERLEEAGVQ